MTPELRQRIDELILRADIAEERMKVCGAVLKHWVYADGESLIRPGHVRSYVCVNCKSRFPLEEVEYWPNLAEGGKFVRVDRPTPERRG